MAAVVDLSASSFLWVSTSACREPPNASQRKLFNKVPLESLMILFRMCVRGSVGWSGCGALHCIGTLPDVCRCDAVASRLRAGALLGYPWLSCLFCCIEHPNIRPQPQFTSLDDLHGTHA
ncbi:hypothetical protein V8C26DRAFT_393752 [Trichoderma gracile]